MIATSVGDQTGSLILIAGSQVRLRSIGRFAPPLTTSVFPQLRTYASEHHFQEQTSTDANGSEPTRRLISR